ncbi:hypothetical protein [Pseudomonas tumuqii]|uniref:hypothetical protein n=1 Tax=Pseudomonas tumuqii TaxID=2715755 RepID=UPI0015519BCA|nr:hypothetical protein [Pseudomonas tumuqii]
MNKYLETIMKDGFVLVYLFCSTIFAIAAEFCMDLNPVLGDFVITIVPGIEKIAGMTKYKCQTESMHKIFWMLILPASIAFAPLILKILHFKKLRAGGSLFCFALSLAGMAFIYSGVENPGNGVYMRGFSESIIINFMLNSLMLSLPLYMAFYFISEAFTNRR